jgi:peroxygenase
MNCIRDHQVDDVVQGRFIPHKFEEIFRWVYQVEPTLYSLNSKYDKDKKGGLTFLEGMRMIRGNRMINDPSGWLAAFFEFM